MFVGTEVLGYVVIVQETIQNQSNVVIMDGHIISMVV